MQPDVFVVRLHGGRRPSYPYDIAHVLLAVEVVSPSSITTDYQRKRDLYVNAGVEYWVVDADACTVAVWRDGISPGALFTGVLEWLPAGMSRPLTIDLKEFFVTALS